MGLMVHSLLWVYNAGFISSTVWLLRALRCQRTGALELRMRLTGRGSKLQGSWFQGVEENQIRENGFRIWCFRVKGSRV